MALYLPNSDSLIVLTPKCGSQWIKKTLADASIFSIEIGLAELRGHDPLSVVGRDSASVAAFIRNSVDWHISYWKYRNSEKSSWDERWQLDRLCASDDFRTYALNVAKFCPQHTFKLFGSFTGFPDRPISFVGRLESIRTDLVAFLRSCGEHFEEQKILEAPAQNQGAYEGLLDPEGISILRDSESLALEAYGYK
jgi:hypothetical protein